MTINFEEDAVDASAVVVEDNKLANIANLATQQLVLEARIAELENSLEDAKEELKQVQEGALPNAMAEVGMSEFKLTDGTKITVKPTYLANIKPEYKDAAFGWLRQHGHDDIIKNNLILSFGRGEDNQFAIVADQLKHMGLADHMTHKEEVHWQTLRAFVKEQLEAGEPLPTEEFGVFIVNKATIKRR
jgi:hypothetical protein